MGNYCETYPRSCCQDFMITTELFDPGKVQQTIEQFPFIKKTGQKLILDPSAHERLVSVYNCQRFDQENGFCLNYQAQERPSFCLNTGDNFLPHGQCLYQNEK